MGFVGLLPDFHCLKTVRYCDCSACRDAASNERSASAVSEVTKREISYAYPKVVDMPAEDRSFYPESKVELGQKWLKYRIKIA